MEYLAKHYAFAGDIDDPNTWQFRLRESNGSYRPVEELRAMVDLISPSQRHSAEVLEAFPAIKKSLRGALRSYSVPNDDMPRYLLDNPNRSKILSEAIGSMTRLEETRMISADLSERISAALSRIGSKEYRHAESLSQIKALVNEAGACERCKAEGGKRYPSKAFATIGDKDDPATWSCRILDESGAVDSQALASAITVLHKSVLAKDAGAGDMRRRLARLTESATEGGRRVVTESLLVTEGKVTAESLRETGTLPIVVIQPGLNVSGTRFYPREALSAAVDMFDGQKMYVNHATDDEDFDRPEGDLHEWVGVIRNPRIGAGGEILAEAAIIDPVWLDKLVAIAEAGELGHLGVSIRALADGTLEEFEDDLVFHISEILAVRSVDFVTEPGAGGRVVLESAAVFDLDTVNLATIRLRRPDLTSAIMAEATALKETDTMDEQELAALNARMNALEADAKTKDEAIESLTKERDEAVAKLAETETKAAAESAKSTINEAIDGSELPDPAKKRLHESWDGKTSTDGLIVAITAEATYLTESGVALSPVEGMGETKPGAGVQGEKALAESAERSYLESGMNPEQAKIRATEYASDVAAQSTVAL